jgi:AraC-like DNA-binding protein
MSQAALTSASMLPAAAPGCRWPGAFIAGPGVTSYVIRVDPAQSVMTIHFRPAGALAFLGCPLNELEDTCVGMTDVWGRSADVLRERLIETRSAADRFAQTELFLRSLMRGRDVRPQPDVASVIRAAELNPSMRVAKAQDMTGLSAKRFNALFRAKVGLSPKSYFRVRRMQAALRALDTGASGATIAADLGYFDQAHFVREFGELAAITPTQYAQRRSSMAGHVELGANLQARAVARCG